MPELAYLDLADVAGELRETRGTLSVDQLLAAEADRQAAHVRGRIARIRLLTRSPSLLDVMNAAMTPPAAQLERALADAFVALRQQPLDASADTPVFLRWTGHTRLKQLASRDLGESVRAWMSSAGAEDVLIEVDDAQPEALEVASRALKRFYGTTGHLPHAPARDSATHEAPHAGITERQINDLHAAAAAKRARLASHWPTAAEVSRAMGSTAGNASHLATKLRREGKLLGVYMLSPTHHYRFPSWQFRADGQPVDWFAEILGVLREQGPFLDADRRTTGWGEVEWFMSPHVLLDDQPPEDVLATDPARVLAAAQAEFGESG